MMIAEKQDHFNRQKWAVPTPTSVGCAHTRFASRLLHDAFFGQRALECFLGAATTLRVYLVAFGQRALRDCFAGGVTGAVPTPTSFRGFWDEAGRRSPGV